MKSKAILKKTIWAVWLMIALLLAACGPEVTRTPAFPRERTNALPSEATASGRVTHVIWYVRANMAEQAWQQDIVIPDFEQKHPNIRINLIVAEPDEFDSKMMAMITAGTPPDIWSHWGPSNFQDYVRQGLVANLTPYVEKDNFDLSDFDPTVLDSFQIDGRLLGLPFWTTGSFVFYNKDLFDRAGVEYPTTNWDDRSWIWNAFLEKCDNLTQLTGDPATDVYGCNLDLWPQDAYAWLWGQNFYPESAYRDGFSDRAFLEDPLVAEAFQARQDLIWKYRFMPGPIELAAIGDVDLFESQKVAMQLTGGWGWWTYSNITDFRWGAAALPYGADNRRDVLFTDPWMLSSKTQHPDEAWTFLKYLVSPEVQRSWMELTGAPPVRLSLAEVWAGQFPDMEPDDVLEVYEGALKYGRESPSHLLVEFNLLNQVVVEAVEPIYNNKKLAADALLEADARLEEVLQQIQARFP